VEAVRASVARAIHRARAGEGPTLIEARTWRWRGHWAGDDQGYRHQPEPDGVEDPLDWFAYRLLERGSATSSQLQRIHNEVCTEVDAALEKARAAQDAGVEELGLDDVFA
jgi:pyruvate dehydrogenase E1 component alpha subunit